MTITHKLNPDNPGSFDGTNLTDATEFSYESASEEVILGTDGKEWVGGTFVDNLHYRVQVTSANASLIPGGAGACGTLVLKAAQRACGDGTTSPLDYTFTNAVFQGSNRRVGHGGTSEVTFNFIVGSSDNTDPLNVSAAGGGGS